MDFYVPAYVGLVIASMGLIGLPVHLAGYRERGVLRRFQASSVSIWTLIGSQVLVTLVLAGLGCLILVVSATLAYGVHAPKAPLEVLLAAVLAGLSFACLGVLLGALMPTARAAQGAGILLWFVMLFLAGSGPPPEVLTRSMRIVGDLTPLKHAAVLLQDLWLGHGWNLGELLVVLGVLTCSLLLSVRLFRWEAGGR
jgi:ABC-2 type transport system permease protein